MVCLLSLTLGVVHDPDCEPKIEEAPGYSLPLFNLSQPIPSNKGDKVAFIAGHSYEDEEIVVWDHAKDILINVSRNFRNRSTYARLQWSPLDGQAGPACSAD